MREKTDLILAVTPAELSAARSFHLPLAHVAYRIGGGPHLYRDQSPLPLRGGWMVIGDAGFNGRGDPAPFCQEVLRECAARGFTGVICDFEGHLPLLGRIVSALSPLLAGKGWTLCVSEQYGTSSGTAKVLIPTALSGGSLRQRLEEAAAQYGPGRVVLGVERVAQDFFLPSPTGQGVPLTQEALRRKRQELDPSIFFSNELCAHYFTYMSRQSGAHFVLFDDASSIRKKLALARSLDIAAAVLPFRDMADLLPALSS